MAEDRDQDRDSDDDLTLLEQWQAGDQAAGNDLCRRHFASMYRFFENKLQSEVDELVQATFLACLHSRDTFRKQCSFRTFLFSIARHQLYGHFRKKKRDQDKLDFEAVSAIDLGTTPTGRLARDQERERLLVALRTLPLATQVLLELHYWEEMTLVELAEVFDINEVTARTRLFRARKSLRAMMEKLAEKPSPVHATVDNLDAWARSLRAKRDAGVSS